MEAAVLIRTARVRRGLTQAELARRAGTSQPVISAYEHGVRDPTTTTLQRVIGASGERLVLSLAGARDVGTGPDRATPEDHARALVDVLLLADAIPRQRRAAALTMPRIVSTGRAARPGRGAS